MIMSNKEPTVWGFFLVKSPKLLTKPGLRNETGGLRHQGTKDVRIIVFVMIHEMTLFAVSDTIVEFLGLIVVEVSRNQAAAISDPPNKNFVAMNSGFPLWTMYAMFQVKWMSSIHSLLVGMSSKTCTIRSQITHLHV